MEINDKLYANKFLESYHVALSMATNALSEVSELQASNLDLASENENLLEQIQEMKAKAWIPVTERLPEEKTAVLLSCDDMYLAKLNHCIGWISGNNWYTFSARGSYLVKYPVAWMPLPEPYEEDKE